MFHKFDAFKFYVKSPLVIPLRLIFIIAVLYFSVDFYQQIESGSSSFRYSSDMVNLEESPVYFSALVLEKLMFSLLFYYFGFYTVSKLETSEKVERLHDQNEDKKSRK